MRSDQITSAQTSERRQNFATPSRRLTTLPILPWWEIYHDESLKQLISRALENNQDLGIALARIDEARALVGFVRADLFPRLDYLGNLFRQEFFGSDSVLPSTRGYGLSVPAFYEIDLWGKFRRSTEAARAELLATEEGYRSAVTTLVAEVAGTYFLLRDLDDRLVVSENTLESRVESTRIIQARFDQGYTSELDLNQAQIEESDARAFVEQFRRDIRQTENALSVLLGENPGPIVRGGNLESQYFGGGIPSGLPSELLQRRPDVLVAEQQLAAQTARIGVATAQLFPSISLTGSFGTESAQLSEFNFGQDKFWSIGGNITGPIFNAGRNLFRLDAEKARTEQAALTYEKTVRQAFQEVEDALIAIRTYQREYLARKSQADAARNAAKLSRARYDSGVTSYLEVLDIERSLFNAELATSIALRNHLNSIVQLYRALGGGWELAPSDPPPPVAASPAPSPSQTSSR